MDAISRIHYSIYCDNILSPYSGPYNECKIIPILLSPVNYFFLEYREIVFQCPRTRTELMMSFYFLVYQMKPSNFIYDASQHSKLGIQLAHYSFVLNQ